MHGPFKFFRKQQRKPKEFDLAAIVQAMFDEANITSNRLDNMFITTIDGVHCSFNTVLRCDDNKPNRLLIYAPLPIPVPKHVAVIVDLELSRLNRETKNAKISMRENDEDYSIFAFTDCEFEKTPTTAEVKTRMIHTIDSMDNANFRSMACAIFGFATYDELEKEMTSNAKFQEYKVDIRMKDGYCTLQDKSSGITSPRYVGRLMMLSAHIIKNKISQERAQQLLEAQTPLNMLIQNAYNVADDDERDVLRKLLYLTLFKRSDSDNDNDSMLGRLEAMSMIEKDKYLLLTGL